MGKRKKVKVAILVFIIISIIVATILIILNNRNKFELNTKYKYRIIKKVIEAKDFTDVVRPIITQYYEINLKNNKVDLREDLYYYDQDQEYSRKLINSKKLTKEEKTELEEVLSKIIKENKTEQITTFVNRKFGECYYIVSTKGIDGVLLDNKEDIEIFERIVN